MRFLGTDGASGQRHLHGLGLADCAHQPLGAADARHDADADFRLGEARTAPGDDDVPVHRQLAAAAVGIAADRHDDRFGAVLDRRPEPLGVALQDIDRANTRHAGNIATGREHALTTGEDDAAYPRIGSQLGEVLAQEALQFETERIVDLGPVEGKSRYPVGGQVEQHAGDIGFGHGEPL